MDREYSASVGFNQDYEDIRKFLYASLLASDSFIYCSLSAIGECAGLAEFPEQFLRMLLDENLLVTVSDYNDPDHFLISRRSLYRDDAGRYPLYFNSPSKESLRLWEPGYVKTIGSTTYLSRMLPAYFADAGSSNSQYSSWLEDLVHDVLAERDERAITIALFESSLEDSEVQTELHYRIRGSISYLYTHHFLNLFSGVVMTDMPFFGVRDRRFRDFRGPSYRLWRHIVPRSWISGSPDGDVGNLATLIELRDDQTLRDVRRQIRHLDEGFDGRPDRLPVHRSSEQLILSAVKRAGAGAEGAEFFAVIRDQLDYALGDHTPRSSPRLIITCANSIEEEALRKILATDRGYAPKLMLTAETTYWDLGRIGETECFLVRTDSGSVGGAASLATLQDAIDRLAPTVVASCGICFGLRPENQRVGDLVVATRIRSYEEVRLGTARDGSLQVRERGQAADLDPVLNLRTRGLLANYDGVEFGEVLSGQKVIDQVAFRDQLASRFPDARVGEMEGSGLVAACGRRRTPWIMIKGISDFADGRKKNHEIGMQNLASSSAASAINYLISENCFVWLFCLTWLWIVRGVSLAALSSGVAGGLAAQDVGSGVVSEQDLEDDVPLALCRCSKSRAAR